ncbi:MAG: hypothetical protein ACI9VM_000401 [Candidatus Azotimanducaceae bacterium]|jgi:hypothetical protein
MNKYIFTGLLVCIFSVHIISVHAQSKLVPSVPQGTSVQTPDKRSTFTQTTTLTADTITVPTVLEVPLNVHIKQKEFAVYERESATYLPSQYIVTADENPSLVSARANTSGSARVLVDDNYTTNLDFALPEVGQGEAEITLNGNALTESSSMVFAFARNVARPLTVALYAVTETGTEEVIVAQKRLSSNQLLFPVTKATQWRLVFTYAQPLRISEVTLVQDSVERDVARNLRFLAQPGNSYDIYLNPDSSVSIVTSESGDLRSDVGVVPVLSPIVITDNQLYRPADSDDDGIPNTIDNCVSLANPEQFDIDNNGRGDMCDDFDRDGRINSADNCPNDPNRRQADEDGDGIGDVCDDEESRITEKYAWIPWAGFGFAALLLGTMFAIVARRPKESEIVEDRVIAPEDPGPSDSE